MFIRLFAFYFFETVSDLIEENLNLVKVMEVSGKYSNVTTYRSSGIDERPGWERAGFTTKSNDSILVSLIFCSVRRGYAFKVRVTARNLTEDVKGFVAAMQELIDQAPA